MGVTLSIVTNERQERIPMGYPFFYGTPETGDGLFNDRFQALQLPASCILISFN